jgi:hypothetical protein
MYSADKLFYDQVEWERPACELKIKQFVDVKANAKDIHLGEHKLIEMTKSNLKTA